MKSYLHAYAMAESMFCYIPSPFRVWDEEARPKMLLFLPLVGLKIGIVWFLLSYLCRVLALPGMITGAALCAYPYIVTGFIHLDGFMDVTDAVRSCRDQARRLEILKDSHVGSFAVVGCVLLMLTGFACCASGLADHRMLLFIPVVSRCCSALAVTVLKPISVSQYAKQQFSKSQAAALVVQLVVCCLLAALLCRWSALALAAGLLGYGLALRKGYTSLGGMNGDVAGYALTVSELCAVAALAILGGMV